MILQVPPLSLARADNSDFGLQRFHLLLHVKAAQILLVVVGLLATTIIGHIIEFLVCRDVVSYASD